MSFIKLNKEMTNAGWLIGGKVMQMGINLVVTLMTARYLGPSNLGLLNYATTYITFFSSLCSLGINAVITRDFVENPEEQGVALGTTFVLRFVSSIFSMITIFTVVSFIDYNEPETITVVFLSSFSILFNIFDTLNCWFHYRYEARNVAITTFAGYLVMAVYKVYLLITEKNVYWFAVATAIDYMVIGALLLAMYKFNKGQPFGFSYQKGKELLRRSYPYILSGMMSAVYSQTDKMMLKQMMGNADVGYYSVAVSICGMWTFVLAAIIDAIFPTIYRLHATNKAEYERKNRQLYAIVIYMCIVVAIVFTIGGRLIVNILYGEEFMPALIAVQIMTWGTMFAYLGVARHAWIVCENGQKYLTAISLVAAIINILMNLLFIPIIGSAGAALASVIAQIVTIVTAIFIRDLRPNTKLMLDAFLLRNVFSDKRQSE